MSRRSRAREVALQSLFQLDLAGERRPDADRLDAISRFHRGRLRSRPLVEFADGLVAGVLARREELDTLIDARSQNWRLSRMAATDRAVLRIAAFELSQTTTPPAVVADEAIELARRYGGESSPRFVAGIVGRLVADAVGKEA
ncbi:MAG: transcription antitermination factor NusB [Planctomycetes bacterium]|nr:transcription antitermination factor NusB [Planctomycetota bacterium]